MQQIEGKWYNLDISEILLARKYQNLKEKQKQQDLKFIYSMIFLSYSNIWAW